MDDRIGVRLAGALALTITGLVGASVIATLASRPSPHSDPAPTTVDAAPREPRDFYVAPHGRAGRDGSKARPLDLRSALSRQTSPARAGDTIWLRGGRYEGAFVSDIEGAAGAPIVVRQATGERATLDGASAPSTTPTLTVRGRHTRYQGFEVTNSNPDRHTERGIGVHVLGAHTALINLIIHDTGNGIGIWSPAVESEVYGNLIFNSGWQENGHGMGHSIYVQNEQGTMRFVENVLFNSYSFGVHAYTKRGRIDHLFFAGNVAFNHGVLAPDGERKANMLIGGWQVALSPTLVGNISYYDGATGRGAELGYHAGCRQARVEGNYFVGGVPMVLRRCHQVTMTGNRFFGPVAPELPREFPDNEYRQSPDPQRPPEVFVRANRYQAGRASVVIFNWGRLAAVPVSLDEAGLSPGARYEVLDAQNYYGPPVARGTYTPGVPLMLTMADETGPTAAPIGATPVAHTSAVFGAFVLQPRR